MLLLPSLDSRGWDQLVDEARRKLPVLHPGWTDHNFSDPGITVIELLAWITETVLYRADRAPPELLRSFLTLLGFGQAAAASAQTVLVLSGPALGTSIALPAALQLADRAARIQFETLGPVTVWPVELSAILSAGPDGSAKPVGGEPGAVWFWPFGAEPEPGAALVLGFDRPIEPSAGLLDLHLWTDRWREDATTAQQLRAELAHWFETCGRGKHAAPAPGWQHHHGVTVAWEYLAAGSRWLPLRIAEDGTRALSLSGFVRLQAPPTVGPDAHVAGGPTPPGLLPIRCRMVEGRFDRAPRLLRIAHNAVAAAHGAWCEPILLPKRSRGSALEVFAMAENPVVPGSTRLEVLNDAGVDRRWREVATFDASGPWDKHYRLDEVTGEIATGDGRQGAPLPAGAELRIGWRAGGGPAGNVAAGSLVQWLDNPHNASLVPDVAALQTEIVIEQAFPATGGRLRETLREAQARAVLALERPDKAVTAADFERLALSAPALPLARAMALARFHPLLPHVEAEGCVTLVVLPDAPGPAPTPTPALLEAVARHLEPRRLITTELHVVAPLYRPLAVEAVLDLDPGADSAELLAAVSQALDRFLHPLTGGTDGAGWPAGQSVNRADILGMLSAAEGVCAVHDLVLWHGEPPVRSCGNVELCPHEFVAPRPHRLNPGDAPAISVRSPPHGCC